MKLKSFEVVGLFGREGKISGKFNEDLNIVTGRNGAGKTTLLKLVWYIISGNILLALKEINFSKATVSTDVYECIVYRLSRNTCKIEITIDDDKHTYEDIRDDEDGEILFNAEDLANDTLREHGSSVFFPTFRRIEGGFGIEPARSGSGSLLARSKNDIEESLITLSRRLTNNSHVFVSSISTVDIVSLLLRRYAELSEVYNKFQQNTSQEVIDAIKAYKSDAIGGTDAARADTANHVLDNIKTRIESMEIERGVIMAPIDAVKRLVEKLFRHSGIKIGNRFNFGDAATAVDSDALSAGEKQLLSFICYNGFNRNSIIFIDEPELSLHVDWQRQLFPILQSQHSSNQFIIATHSPFIYSKYPDKEILIDQDRGDVGA